MKHLMLCVVLLCTACSQSPAGPTAQGQDPTTVATKLRWEVAASGCPATATPSPKPDLMAATFHQEPDGSITASWPYEVGGRPVVLYANFVEINGAFMMCSWDTADV